jgi:GH24 family phage-related lysozyme (muramidase)
MVLSPIGTGPLVLEIEREKYSNGITDKEASELLMKDLQKTYDIIYDKINHSTIASFIQNQFDAFVSFVFNIGPGSTNPRDVNRGLEQSTVKKYMNDEDTHQTPYPTLESAWKAFNNQGQLNSRRDIEWRLYQNGDYSDSTGTKK